MPKELAVVLNHGTINSAVVSALAAQKYRPIFVHAEVQEQTGSRQRAAYDQQVAHFKPYREHTVPLPHLAALEPPVAAHTVVSDPRVQQPVTPSLLHLLPILSAGVQFAVHYEAAAIYVGTRVGAGTDELARATEFMQVWSELVQLPLDQPNLMIESPLMELDAWQVVDLAFQVDAPLERTWSCFEDSGEPCWACRGCRSREAAFQQAAKPDPLRTVRAAG